MSSLYDPDRIKKIGEILPGLCQYAQRGDKIHLGLDGDPEFPYRGSSRPTGVIRDIRADNDATIVVADMNDGSTKHLSSRTVGAYDTWEFTEDGFNGVLKREQEKAARAESALEYRGTNNDMSIETKMARLEGDLAGYGESQDAFRKTVVATMREIASDVVKLAQSSGSDAKFCNVLTSRYDQMVEARAESSFRGGTDDHDPKFDFSDCSASESDGASSDSEYSD